MEPTLRDVSGGRGVTVSRFTLMMSLALFPLSAWGQVLTAPLRPDLGSESAGQSIADSENQAGAGYAINPGPDPQSKVGASQRSNSSVGTNPNARYSAPIWHSTARGGYFGIMGAIAQPGVYFHPQERVPLAEVLKLAGGPTPDVSGGVRIVRQGRGGLQTFLSQDSKYELLNGDVVLLESRNSPGQAGLKPFTQTKRTLADENQDGDSSQQAAIKQAAAAPGYLAFVNLTPQPIIVPVPKDQASLSAVMTWLRQDPKSPPYVRVIAPGPVLRRDNSVPADEQLLESGTVLVFDSATVKHERLPEFPPVKGLVARPTAEQAPRAAVPPPSPSPIPTQGNTQSRTQGRTQGHTQTSTLGRTERRTPSPVTAPQPPMTRFERPAERAIRPSVQLPNAHLQAPNPPAEPKTETIPGRGLGQRETSNGNSTDAAAGGPMLLMPQNQSGENSRAANPDFKSRAEARPGEIRESRPVETTSASFKGQQLSWQSSAAIADGNIVNEAFEQGIVQAHREQDLDFPEEQGGPQLELPRPVPNLLPAEAALIPHTSEHANQEVPSPNPARSGSVTLRIFSFSLTGVLVLCAILWWMLRRDGLRPSYARARDSRASHTRTNHGRSLSVKPGAPANGLATSVLKTERLPIRRTDSVVGRNSSTASTPSTANIPLTADVARETAASEPADSALPPPLRAISQREHALRAHFRQARMERMQRTILDNSSVEEPAAPSIPNPETLAPPAQPAVETVIPAPNFKTRKSADALDRALHVRRSAGPADSQSQDA